jgi:hypothetical protein
MTCLLRLGRIQIAVVGFVSALIPAVTSAECLFVTMPQAMASPMTIAIFSGTVSEIEESAGAVVHVVTFDVQRVWKGTVTKRVSLQQLNTSDAIEFSAGVPYLIVAYRLRPEEREVSGTIRRGTALGIDACASKLLEQAERLGDVRELGSGRPIP